MHASPGYKLYFAAHKTAWNSQQTSQLHNWSPLCLAAYHYWSSTITASISCFHLLSCLFLLVDYHLGGLAVARLPVWRKLRLCYMPVCRCFAHRANGFLHAEILHCYMLNYYLINHSAICSACSILQIHYFRLRSGANPLIYKLTTFTTNTVLQCKPKYYELLRVNCEFSHAMLF